MSLKLKKHLVSLNILAERLFLSSSRFGAVVAFQRLATQHPKAEEPAKREEPPVKQGQRKRRK